MKNKSRVIAALSNYEGPKENVGLLCADCSEDARKPDPRYAEMPLTRFVDRDVKIKFVHRDGSRLKEYMWVRVKSITRVAQPEGRPEMAGFLNQDPVLCTYLKSGDIVTLNRKDIIDVLEPPSPHRKISKSLSGNRKPSGNRKSK